MTLKLEYSCTEAELKEAKALDVQRQCGGGPKWRAQAVYWGFIAIVAALVGLRFKMEIAAQDRWWFIALVVVVFIALQIFKRMTRRKPGGPVRVEVSEQGLVFAGEGRATMAWSAFSACLESPALFVLLNRSKTILYTVPKRAFPDESAQNWFRTLANRPTATPAGPGGEPVAPGRFAGKGITLTVQLTYRDHLTRMLTSWRMKGIVLLIFAVIGGSLLYNTVNPPPDAVVPPEKVALITLATMVPMLAVVFLAVAFISWRSERKSLTPQHLALGSEGIEFAGSDTSGILPWSTYRYYLENRWAFFLWQPQGSLWLMLPKREFTAPSDLEQCRELLRTNLKASRWFYM